MNRSHTKLIAEINSSRGIWLSEYGTWVVHVAWQYYHQLSPKTNGRLGQKWSNPCPITKGRHSHVHVQYVSRGRRSLGFKVYRPLWESLSLSGDGCKVQNAHEKPIQNLALETFMDGSDKARRHFKQCTCWRFQKSILIFLPPSSSSSLCIYQELLVGYQGNHNSLPNIGHPMA